MTRRGWRLPVRPFGVPIELDPSFALILPLFTLLIAREVGAFATLFADVGVRVDPAVLAQGVTPWLLGLSAGIGLFASVLVHELGHALVARRFEVKTLRITLWFLGGMAQLEDVPRQRGAEAAVAIAGPITSALIAIGLGLLLQTGIPSGPIAFIAAYLTVTNTALALFNLLPALPLDGGRILRSLLSLLMGDRQATRVVGGIGQLIAISMGVYGFLTFQVFLMAIAFFIYVAGRAEIDASHARAAFAGRVVREAMTADPVAIEYDWTVAQARRLRSFRPHTAYPVLDGEGRPLGWLRSRDLDDADDEALVGQRLHLLETVLADAALESAVRRLAQSESRRLLVVERDGRAVGILASADLVRYLQSSDG
jgi:Zn-dependent protease/CBS domain-containing protein